MSIERGTHLGLTGEQRELREVVRLLCERESPSRRVHEVAASDVGFDGRLWKRLAADIGVAGLAVAEDMGGAGVGYAHLAVVAEELGRALACVPFLSTAALSASILSEAADADAADDRAADGNEAQRLLRSLAAGELVVAAALGVHHGSAGRVVATAGESGRFTLEGRTGPVIDGQIAGTVVLQAWGRGGLGFYVVDTGDPAVLVEPLATVDRTRRCACVTVSGAPARRLNVDVAAATATAVNRTRLVLAAEAVGGMRRLLAMTVEHVASREQFGRPVGSFQAVKHTCAEMLVDLEASAATVAYARAVAADPDRLDDAAALAKSYACAAYLEVAENAIHLHGGIGFTWEHDAHLYYERALTIAALFGDARELSDEMAWAARRALR